MQALCADRGGRGGACCSPSCARGAALIPAGRGCRLDLHRWRRAAIGFSGSAGTRPRYGVPQSADAIAVLQHALKLTLDDGPHLGREILLERRLVVLHGSVLGARALAQDRPVILALDRGLDIDHTAPHGATRGAVRFRISTESPYFTLELLQPSLDEVHAVVEERLCIAALDGVGARAEVLHAILARRDEIIEHRDDIVPVHCHSHPPRKRDRGEADS